MEVTVNVIVQCQRCHHEFETEAMAEVEPHFGGLRWIKIIRLGAYKVKEKRYCERYCERYCVKPRAWAR